ncbi:MAG: PH domain-containing protein [Bacteroidales bacterium]|nr:PH domain-containing protein [Bacteroidales bacterium]
MKKYKSKIGTGIVLITGLIFTIVFIIMFIHPNWPGIAIVAVAAGFTAHLIFSTYYVIQGDILIIKSGFIINKKVNINRIKKITETNNILSAPAASLDRIAIYCENSEIIMISPKDKMNFINDLIKVNSNIEVVVEH